jgi:hypothetical protein
MWGWEKSVHGPTRLTHHDPSKEGVKWLPQKDTWALYVAVNVKIKFIERVSCVGAFDQYCRELGLTLLGWVW